MRILVLWAHEESPNLGVAALARGSRDLLRRVWPEAELVFVNYGQRPAELPFGRKRSLLRESVLNELGMKRWLRSFDIAWDTRSGDSFADIYGMGRHNTMSLVFELAVRQGVTGVMAPQTIGPFQTRAGRALAKRTLSRASFVASRDPLSTDAAAALGRPVDAQVSDLVFAIDPPAPAVQRDVIVNVSGLLWTPNPHVDHEKYRSVVGDVVTGLMRSGREVTLLAHVRGRSSSDDDLQAVTECAERFGVESVIPRDLDDVRSTIGAAQLMIGARMHACLNALSVGVPAIPMAYSRKFEPLMSTLSWDHGVDLRRDADPTSRILEVALGDDLSDQARQARDKGRSEADRLAGLIRGLR